MADDQHEREHPHDTFWRAIGGPAWQQWLAATGREQDLVERAGA